MRVKGFFVGAVSGEVRAVESGGKSFKAFLLESQGPKDKYPNKLKVLSYSDRTPPLAQGAVVAVSGDVSSEGWMGNDTKPKSNLKMFAESIEVHGSVEPVAAPIPSKDGKEEDSLIPF